MAERLTIKNFGPISNATFDLKKVTVVTGAQASGKSTVAKLTTIFRSFLFLFCSSNEKRKKFAEFGIEDYFKPNTELEYTSTKCSIKFKDGKFDVDYYDTILDEMAKIDWTKVSSDANLFGQYLELYRKASKCKEASEKASIEKEMKELLVKNRDEALATKLFLSHSETSHYVPADRLFFASIQGAVFGLLDNSISLPKTLLSFGKSYENAKRKRKQKNLPLLNLTMKTEGNNDYLILPDGTKIDLANAASGYQALIPMLLVLEQEQATAINTITHVIEEPEICLFPVMQKKVLYYIIEQCTDDLENLIITTHSPYILSSINTILLASRGRTISESHKSDVNQIISPKINLKLDDFACYYLDNSGAHSIYDSKIGMISENELDSISEEIGDEFDSILRLISNK